MITDLTIIGNKITINSNKDNILTDEAVPVFPVGYKLIVNGLKINNGILDLDYTVKSSTPIPDSATLKSIVKIYVNDQINTDIKDIKDTYGAIEYWDVSKITDMSYLFDYTTIQTYSFNQDISRWDVSNVIDMTFMFNNTTFNQDISRWNVSKVNHMSFMFNNNLVFNQDLSGWNTINVTDMNRMLTGTIIENQPRYYPKVPIGVTTWPFNKKPITSDAIKPYIKAFYIDPDNIEDSIYGAIEYWDVSKITDMTGLLRAYDNEGALFNQDISRWDVSNVTNMNSMFSQVRYFNQDISSWDVSKVVSMNQLFQGATVFNQNLYGWDVSGVTTATTFGTNSAICSTESNLPRFVNGVTDSCAPL